MDRASAAVPLIGPFFYNYTVFVGDDKFTVTEPNDSVFLEYFLRRCIEQDEPAQDELTPDAPRKRSPGLIRRIFRWMAQPI